MMRCTYSSLAVMIMIERVILSFMVIFYVVGFGNAYALPTTTQILKRIGQAQVGEAIPFFSGWNFDEQVVSSKKILQNQSKKGFLLIFCAQWDEASSELLDRIYQNRAKLEEKQIALILVIEDAQPKDKLQKWLQAHQVLYATILLDPHQQLSDKFGLKHEQKISTNQMLIKQQQAQQALKDNLSASNRISKPDLIDYKKANPKDLFLPRSLTFDLQGKVKGIWGIEGKDYLDLVIKSLE
jgi:hypothetical protein